ncbi:LacI family DNA-binding transcriptional regulator [Streptomyces sp. ID05-04B]|uniref:LacI family DNA-binding transcriptional regulator n=1 Tax=unclassified Streptomyces TaxID=2593676 RepID=UPI000D1AAA5E|nr:MULTISPECIES: LacI family DNA-binding transcriptional regulator [unclassified Streptomyces]AVV43979.1 LacI family transcriptional regulator [Streptomyces sp. P3]MDX5567840.1 LacI family DNA-binding transcriptional regulator [Streptomyces sp. ID05-04B]
MESSRVWRRPTLDAVAARAGVSTATVSNALNGTGRLSEATRQRVLATARELGYAPASTARALARGRTGVLGLTMTTYGDLPVSYTEIPYYATLTLSAMAAAHERGYLLLTMPNSMSPWMWLNTPMDGVIHVAPRADDPVRALLRERGIPMISEGRPPRPHPGDAWVDSDHESGLRLLLDHLAESGARRIGLSLPLHDDAYPQLVTHAYRGWCDEHRLPALVEEYAVLPDYFTAEQGAVGRLLDRDPRPDAVIGVYSDSGHNILAAARHHGLRVPGDLLVACVSEDPEYASTAPPVTTLGLRPDRVGTEAVDLLISVINSRSAVNRRRLVQPVLVPRRSTRRAAGRGSGAP